MAKGKFLRNIGSGYQGPGTPQNVQANAVSSSGVSLTWPAVSGADTYTIRRSIAGAPYSIIAQNVVGVTAPPGAVADGFTQLVLGPSVTMGLDWFDFNMPGFGTGASVAGQSRQNPDGSVFISGVSNNNFGLSISTMHKLPSGAPQGIAFTECYVDFLISLPGNVRPAGSGFNLPFLACWSASDEKLRGVPAAYGSPQPANCQRYSEWDVTQFEEQDARYADMGGNWDWSCSTNPLTGVLNQGAGSPNGLVDLKGVPWSNQNRFGGSWSKATSTTQGEQKRFINDVQVTPSATPNTSTGRILWNQWFAGQPWPPVNGSTAGSFIDQQFMVFLIGTSQLNPVTVYEVRVFQRPGAVNRIFP